MGISGLLPLLKSIHKPCHLKKFGGQTIGVDAYGWLHRGTVACAVELAMGKPTRKHIEFSMHRVRMLLHFGVIPYLVFDGDYLPSKSKTEVDRAKRREESRQKGLESYRLNKPSQAQLEFQKAIDVTPEMARELIEELKKIGVQYVVAPYEADAQLVYLERRGIIQGMLSEDSDLLVFGAKRLLTKLDQYGECVEVNRNDFTLCKEISLVGWSDAEFRRMAILSGCDYLANINRMGLKSAYRIVRKYKTAEKIVRMLQFEGQLHVPAGYLEEFRKAELTFLYQRVFCPLEQLVVTMSEPEDGTDPDDLPFLGEKVEQPIAIGISRGDLDPMTKAPIFVSKPTPATSPRTPWVKNAKASVITPLEKENKSIEQFFKSTRTPLAELNPNIFNPSPTQQQLLRRASESSWTSSPAASNTPTPHIHQSITSQNSVNRSRQRVTGVSDIASCQSSLSRKRKIGSEIHIKESFQNTEDLEGTRSKFFDAAGVRATSSGTHQGRTRRKRPTDFTVWSDDSTEDAMAELADSILTSNKGQDYQQKQEAQVVSAPTKSLALSLQKGEEDRPPQTETQSTKTSVMTLDSSLSEDTTGTSFMGSQGANCVTTEQLSSKGTYEQAQGSRFENREAATQGTQKGKMIFEKFSGVPRITQKPALPRSASMGALQTLGARAFDRVKATAPSISSHKKDYTACSSFAKRSSLDSPLTCKEGSKPSLPLSYSIGPDASSNKGSEDAMVPASQESDQGASEGDGGRVSDTVSEVEDTPPRKCKSMNLGQFTFQG